jgi:hypothetical protein
MDLKTVKNGLSILLSIVALGFGLTACGGSGGSTSVNSSSTPAIADTDKITISPSNNRQVTTAAIDAISGGFNFTNDLPAVDLHMLSSAPSSQNSFKKTIQFAQTLKSLSLTSPQACPDGGNLSLIGNPGSGTVIYEQCQYGTVTFNGRVTLSSNAGESSGTVTYNHFTFSKNGEIVVSLESTIATYQFDRHKHLQNISITMNGYFITLGERTDFKNFTFALTNDANKNVTFKINGFVKTACLGAWIEVVTNEDIKLTQSASCPHAGKLTIGGNASNLVVTFNADLSSDLSVNGATPTHYPSCKDLDTGICAL